MRSALLHSYVGFRPTGSNKPTRAFQAPLRKSTMASQPTTTAQASPAEATKSKYTLKTAGGGQYNIAAGERVAVATAGAGAFLRLGSGAFVASNVADFKNRPKEPVILYEFEGCPFCRKVREAVTLLDIDVLFYPCPKGGPNFRPKAQQLSGKAQFPFMVDPNTGRQMLESDAIVQYLWDTYGDGQVPLQFRLGPVTTLSIGLGLLPRGARGIQYRPSRLPKEPLEIWAYEASPFCKLAREVLTELEIPHVYHSVGRKSPSRPAMEAKWGTFQVPYLEDPNTSLAMFESKEIIDYLNDTYAAKLAKASSHIRDVVGTKHLLR